MLLFITSEPNIVSDFIVLSYGPDIFRFNLNLWRDYRVAFTEDGWEISNTKNSRRITSEIVTKCYWWKAFSGFEDDNSYVKEEIKYTVLDIYGWCSDKGIVKGNSPYYHSRYGKLTILGKAKKYFATPRTLVSVGLYGIERLEKTPVVVKSLSAAATNNNKVLMTTEVNVAQLDPGYPWYIQEKIDSLWDVTVFYCNNRCFPFKRSRAALKSLDWRLEQFTSNQKEMWVHSKLNCSDEDCIKALSDDLHIEFGRYDFLTVGDRNTLVFLELNAGGQWMFLDPSRKYGLLNCVVSWLKA